MKLLAVLLGYFSLASSVAAEPLGTSVFSKGDAEFAEALITSFLIVCVYLLYWLENKDQY